MIVTASQNPRFAALGVLWMVACVIIAAVGPFGTYESMAFWPRLFYWSLIVTIAWGLDIALRRTFPVTTLVGQVTRRLVYVSIFSVCLSTLNTVLIDMWDGFEDFFLAFSYVLVVAIFIEVIVSFLLSMKPVDAAISAPLETVSPNAADPALTALIGKLPENMRGEILHLEAQGHYLRVLTDKGEAQMLMRFSDAIVGLPEALGIQTHRSHWIALAAAKMLVRTDGKQFVQLKGDGMVPVSKTRLAAVKAALIQA